MIGVDFASAAMTGNLVQVGQLGSLLINEGLNGLGADAGGANREGVTDV
jgi:hypothetical protein